MQSVEALIEVFPSASINIADATESPGHPIAQIEQREIKRSRERIWCLANGFVQRSKGNSQRNRVYQRRFRSLESIFII